MYDGAQKKDEGALRQSLLQAQVDIVAYSSGWTSWCPMNRKCLAHLVSNPAGTTIHSPAAETGFATVSTDPPVNRIVTLLADSDGPGISRVSVGDSETM